MEIQGRRALVLGGTAGIGLATAGALRDEGAQVLAASRTASTRDAARQTLGEGVELRDLDVRDRSQLERLFRDMAPFDILVCCATGGDRAIGPFLEMDLDGFQGSFDKLWGYTNAVRLGAEHMASDGTIVLVSGSPARKASPGTAALSSVGNAVEGFVRAIAPEIVPRRINVVSPGLIATEMFALPADKRDAALAHMTKDMLIPRVGQPEEVAEAILFLIRNEFVTGTTVDVDGGALLP